MKFISPVAVAIAVAACVVPAALAGSPAGRLHTGSHGPAVAELQQFLRMNQRADYYGSAYDGAFGPLTQTGLTRWQKAAGYQATGTVVTGSSQWNQLRREAVVDRLAAYISPEAIRAARLTGWAVDASKSPATVSVLRYDSASGRLAVTLSISAAYGGNIGGVQYATNDGVFRIYAEEGPDFVSRIYNNAKMPYAACFNGGQCLHYDGLFPSHGCIHIPSWSAAQYIDRLPIGTTVVVHG